MRTTVYKVLDVVNVRCYYDARNPIDYTRLPFITRLECWITDDVKKQYW